MNFWPFTRKPAEPAPRTRYVVATKGESLIAAVRKVNLHNQLRAENAVNPREPLPRPALEVGRVGT